MKNQSYDVYTGIFASCIRKMITSCYLTNNPSNFSMEIWNGEGKDINGNGNEYIDEHLHNHENNRDIKRSFEHLSIAHGCIFNLFWKELLCIILACMRFCCAV